MSNSDIITTLDGQFWNKQEIIEKMRDDEFYYGYLGKYSLSSSSCTSLLQSPLKYERSLKGESVYTDSFGMGNLVHYRILEPHKFNEMKFINVKGKTSKIFKEAVEEYGARNTFTIQEKYQAEDLSDCFLNNSVCTSMLLDAKYEEPAIGEIEGLPFRGKADVLGDGYILDIKTTGKDLKSFRYSANSWNYDVQCYVYTTLFDISYKDFIFAVIDKSSGSLGLFRCSKEFWARGKEKTMDAIKIYRDYFVDKKKRVEEFFIQDVL